eukprot:TRINITY_DN20794_c0_g1_i1.p1 TRINITY_DN20794_c0_g1~~TRINITY_DN20794_c0_g1_i1.p1  ORF type:complete len:281 (+),score=63.70 TRINITY_DN20794_c0_g1_i1:57-899(+)
MGLAARTSGGCVKAGFQGRVGVLVVDNFKKRNALCGRAMVTLREGFNALKEEGVAAVLVCGSKGRFCSGAEMPTLVHGGFQDYMHTTLEGMRAGGPLTYALLEGHAIGGGAELAMSADQRIWTETSSLQFVQTKMGITTGWGGTKFLAEAVGRSTALRLLCTSHNVSSYAEAQALRIADHHLTLPPQQGRIDVNLEGVGPCPLTALDAEAVLTPLARHALSFIDGLHKHNYVDANSSTKEILASQPQDRLLTEQREFSLLWRNKDHNAALEAVWNVPSTA